MWSKLWLTACIFVSLLANVLFSDLCELRKEIYDRARQTGSDSVLILRKDAPVFEFKKAHAPERVNLKEMADAIYALGILSLVDDQSVPCVDTPLHRIFPEVFEKSALTLKHLVSHVSGLTRECEQKWVIKSIERLSGKSLEDYLGEKIFFPLGIHDFSVVRSSSSHHLYLSIESLGKIGSMIANQGRYLGKKILSFNAIRTLTKPSSSSDPFFGFGWYLEVADVAMVWKEPLLVAYSEMNFPTPFLKKLIALQGREIHFGGLVANGKVIRLWGHELFSALDCPYTEAGHRKLQAFFSAISKRNLSYGSFKVGAIKSIVAKDQNGLQLIIMPKEETVAVRIAPSVAPDFDDFLDLVEAFSKEYECLP